MLVRRSKSLAVALVSLGCLAALAACGSDASQDSPAPGSAAGAGGEGGSGGAGGGTAGAGGSAAGAGGSTAGNSAAGTDAAGGDAGAGQAGEGGAGGAGEAGAAGAGEAGAGGSGEAGGGGSSAGGSSAAGAGGSSEGGAAGAAGGDVGGGKIEPAVAVHALRKVWAGDTDTDGKQSSLAWRKFGFDLDGQASAPDSTGHCKAQLNGKKANIQDDGDNGIDNSFGRNVLPTLLTVPGASKNPSSDITSYIAAGVFSMLLNIDGLPQGGDATGLPTAIFAARGQLDETSKSGFLYPTDATWADGSYPWRALSTSVASLSPLTSKAFFPSSSIAGYTWTSGSTSGALEMIIPFDTVEMHLRIHSVRLKTTFAADNKTSTGGIIGGVLNTEEFVAELQKVAGQLDPNYCFLAGILGDQVRAASDIMLDGSQDPDKQCNGISMGIGFETNWAQLNEVIVPEPSVNPCSP
jgi:hypothetical protein